MNNYITKIFNPTYLCLLWRSPKEKEGFFAIAKIERKSNGSIIFYYLKDTEDYKNAQNRGFDGYSAFPEKDKIYTTNVLELFMRRLPPKKREDFKFYLNQLGLDQNIEIPDFALLGYSGAQLATDDFKLVYTFDNLEVPCEVVMGAVGVRHCLKDMSVLQLNERVNFVPDPTNIHDPNAIIIEYRGDKIGYVSRVQSESFLKILKIYNVSALIQKINGTEKRPKIWVKVSIS